MPTRARLLLVLAFVAFVSVGLPDGLLGVAWPSMRRSFGLPLDALGSLFVSTTLGNVTASFLSGVILRRILYWRPAVAPRFLFQLVGGVTVENGSGETKRSVPTSFRYLS